MVEAPGTYALVLACRMTGRLRVGRLGQMRLAPGFYVYVGSAFGPGGLRARIGHHLRRAARPHWHIDYLLARAAVHSVWFQAGEPREEHDWARLIGAVCSAAAVPGFGCSDCNCRTHLFYFAKRPSAAMRRVLGAAVRKVVVAPADFYSRSMRIDFAS